MISRTASRFAALALGLAALTPAAFAQDAAAKVQSGSYDLEPTHAQVLFGVSHFGFSTYYGAFPGATGVLVLDSADPSKSQLDVTVPVEGVWTASPKLAEELRSADWLDAKAFPTMTFHSTKVTVTSPTTADIEGDLTLHGVTHPIHLTAHLGRAATNLMTRKYTVGFEVTGHLKRSEFGVSKYVAFGLADDVGLIISAPFERKAQ